MPTSPQAFSSLAMPAAMSMGLIALALYVALELSQRARIDSLGARNGWLVLSALALSGGVVSAQILQLCSLLGPLEAGFHPGLLISAALAALVLSSAALNWVLVANLGWLRLLSGAALLGLATTLGQALAVASAGVVPSVRWHLGSLAVVWLAGTAGFVWLLLIAAQPRKATSFRPQPRLFAAAAGAGAAVLAGQSIQLAASTLGGSSPVDDPTLLSSQTMATLASIGLAELLLLMLLACAIEARLRSKLESSSLSAHEGYRDGLTRLPTRTTFEGTLAQVLQNADSQRTPAVLLHVALDRFKPINDSFGHQAGDAVLRCMALRLKALAPPHRVARLGGDEFLLLLDGKESLEQSTLLAAAILESTSQPCPCEGRELTVTCSIGIAQYPRHGARAALITHATVATRASKAAGGATYSVFDPRMVDDVRDQAELLNDLRQALMRGQMELYYQPKIHAPSAQVTAAEALLRWHHPRRGMISPAVFIPLAERNGLIGTLGAWVIDEACKQARLWRDQGLRMRVAINLSAHQLRQPKLPAHIAAALAKHQINPDLLTCEITESVAMEDTEATMRFFSELAAVGVHISIDDFGSGYSSLAYLRKLPATELKIDRGFVLDLENSEEARKIAEAVVNLAQALNMKVVAEGVETDAQYQILRRLGCDQVQGFLFAKPMTAKALALWASGTEGPRSIQFRESLFKETSALVA